MSTEMIVKLVLFVSALLIGIRYIIAPDKLGEDLNNPEAWPEDPDRESYPALSPYQFPIDWADFHVHEDF